MKKSILLCCACLLIGLGLKADAHPQGPTGGQAHRAHARVNFVHNHTIHSPFYVRHRIGCPIFVNAGYGYYNYRTCNCYAPYEHYYGRNGVYMNINLPISF